MKKLFVLIVIVLLFVGKGICDHAIEKELKALKAQMIRNNKVAIGVSEKNALEDYLLRNNNVKMTDFEEARRLYFVTDALGDYLSEKYNANSKNYKRVLKNDKDKKVFSSILKIRKRMYLQQYILCKDNEGAALNAYNKIRDLRRDNAKILDSGINTEEYVRLNEKIIEECRFESHALLSLLEAFRYQKHYDKYNALMLRMIEDDQVKADYLYTGFERLNDSFIRNYIYLLAAVNRPTDNYLSRNQIEFLADDILTKHKEIFNFKNSYYISEIDGEKNWYSMRNGVRALIHVMQWLDKYNLQHLKKNILDQFFNDELVAEIIGAYDEFDEFKSLIEK